MFEAEKITSTHSTAPLLVWRDAIGELPMLPASAPHQLQEVALWIASRQGHDSWKMIEVSNSKAAGLPGVIPRSRKLNPLRSRKPHGCQRTRAAIQSNELSPA